MASDWKARDRAINAYFMGALAGAFRERGVTPTEVARRAGMAQQQVSDWMANKRVMTAARFVILARAAGLDDAEIGLLVKQATERARQAGLFDTAPSLRLVSDPDGNVGPLAAGKGVQDEMEINAQD